VNTSRSPQHRKSAVVFVWCPCATLGTRAHCKTVQFPWMHLGPSPV
jgi:hypothetical protein